MSAPAVAAVATMSTLAALAVGWLLLMKRAERRCQEHTRKTVAARRDAMRPAATRPDGSHETCELTEGERLWAEYFARRYSSLGRGVTR